MECPNCSSFMERIDVFHIKCTSCSTIIESQMNDIKANESDIKYSKFLLFCTNHATYLKLGGNKFSLENYAAIEEMKKYIDNNSSYLAMVLGGLKEKTKFDINYANFQNLIKRDKEQSNRHARKKHIYKIVTAALVPWLIPFALFLYIYVL